MATRHYNYTNTKGEFIPSVTELLQFVNNHLDSWANYMGFKNIDSKKYALERAEYGTYIHNIASKYFIEGKDSLSFEQGNRFIYEDYYNILIGKLDTLKTMLDSKGYVFLHSELSLCGEKFGGTVDLIFQNTETEEILILDFKTSKSTYPKQFIQLAGYTLLLEEVKNYKTKAVGIVLIEKQPNEKSFLNIRSKEKNEYNEKIFKSILDIYYNCVESDRTKLFAK